MTGQELLMLLLFCVLPLPLLLVIDFTGDTRDDKEDTW